MKLIAEGAEARIYDAGSRIIKQRQQKRYRIAAIDEKLRSFRTRREAKVLEKLAAIDFPSPRLLSVSDKTMKISMGKIKGKKLRDVLNKTNCRGYCGEVGGLIGTMHRNNIVHGDLTTSNMIVADKIHFVDFGLSFFSAKAEDFAVDLHLLRQALESYHNSCWESCFAAAVAGYKKNMPSAAVVLKRLEKVEQRGRYKKGS